MLLSGWSLYNTACLLVDRMYANSIQQTYFKQTLFQYLLLFSIMAIVIGSVLHYYLTKKVTKPVRQLIASTKTIKKGIYPQPIPVTKNELGEFIQQYNELMQQLQTNEQQRKKLITDLSHEIRTPLSNINGYLYALQSGVVEGNEVLYQSLYRESTRLTSMMNQLEQLKKWDVTSSPLSMPKQEVDISSLLTQCLEMFQLALNQHNLTSDCHVESCNMYIHEEGIYRVVSNLIENAISYYEGNGPIKLHGARKHDDYYIAITGPGQPIPEQEKAQLFQRFYRIDQSRSRDTGGSGLGLAIAKDIVGYHEGEIGVETNNNVHTFWFTLPITPKT